MLPEQVRTASPFEGDRCGPRCQARDQPGVHRLDDRTVDDQLVEYECDVDGCPWGTTVPRAVFEQRLADVAGADGATETGGARRVA